MLKINPNSVGTLVNRGMSYTGKYDYDLAIADFDQALKLSPTSAAALNNRGLAYNGKENFERAIQDFTAALKINPKLAGALNGRGNSQFLLARYDAAAADLTATLALDPNRPYAVMWLHLARLKAGGPNASELARNAAKIDMEAWTGKIVSFYMGKIDLTALRLASGVGSVEQKGDQQCELAYYWAQDEIFKKNTQMGIELLKEAVEICLPSFIERLAATAELKRLGQ